MTVTSELGYTLLSAVLIAVLAAVYGVRVAVKGRVHFDRIDRQGGTRLLTKGSMELGYWMLQPVARLLVFLRIGPNTVSWASLVFGILAGACLAVGHFGFGAVLATVSGFLDSLDGMVARRSGVASDAGEILDAVVDRYVEFVFLAGLIVYYRQIPGLQVLALLALLGTFMVSYSTAKAEALQVSLPKGAMRRPERAVYLILGAALSTVTIPWFESQWQSTVQIGYPMVLALGLVALMANVSSIERFWFIAKAIRARESDSTKGLAAADENPLTKEQKLVR
jgi:CDP-diacylglycerol---glycerol-3-phosphate 3-phosphatidyltransferase